PYRPARNVASSSAGWRGPTDEDPGCGLGQRRGRGSGPDGGAAGGRPRPPGAGAGHRGGTEAGRIGPRGGPPPPVSPRPRRPDAPPPGTGFMPARGPLGRWRDRAAAALIARVFRTALPALNQARAELGLPPVRGLADVMSAASRVLVCTSPGYDFAAGAVPANVRYVGPQLDDVSAGTWDDPGGSPLVLVGLSSTVMSHEEELLQRAAEALGRLPVRGLVTTGPAVNPAAIRAPANVSVRQWV